MKNPFVKAVFAAQAAVVFTLPLGGAVAAETGPASATALDPVVVTATRSPEPASQLNAAVTVITREQLDLLQGQDVGDALAQVAGIDVIRQGGPGQSPLSVFIRGTDSKQVLVLVDGVRLRDGVNARSPLEDIPLEAIDHIEVVKGPRSNQWGSDAIGGVIQIFTRQARPGLSGELAARAGRYDSTDFSGTAGYRSARGGVSLSLEKQDTKGYPPLVGATVNAGHNNLAGTLSGDLDVGNGRITLRHFQSSGTTQYLNAPSDTQAVSSDFEHQTSALGWSGAVARRWNTSLSFELSEDRSDQNQVGFGTTRDFFHTNRRGFDWQNDFDLGPNQAQLGVQVVDEATKASSSDSTFSNSTGTTAAFLQDAFTWGRHTLLGATRYTHHETFGGHTTGSLDYTFRLTPGVALGLSYGTAFRAPTASDLFQSFPAFGFFANPNLQPETSHNLEASLKARLTPSQSVEAHVFRNRINDLIGSNGTTSINIGHATITGAELGYRFVQGPWAFHADGSLQRPVDDSTGKRLLRRASKSLTTGLTRQFGPHRLGLEVQAMGDRPDKGFDPVTFASFDVRNGGYALLNLSGEAQLLPHLTLGAKVENLLDHQYTTVFGYRQSGTAVYGTLRYRW